MSLIFLTSTLNRLTLRPAQHAWKNYLHTTTHRQLQLTPCLMAEPLKKKKRVDPAVIRAREERRKKKLEKQIRRLEKNAKQLKPIEECEVPLTILDERSKRKRELEQVSAEVLEQRVLLEKSWANYKRQLFMEDIKTLDKLQFSQQKALDELKNESELLYEEALKLDTNLLPFKSVGPVETPPIKNYQAPDGDYVDVTKNWDN